MGQVIYFTAPCAVRDTDRYEEYFYHIGHHFKDAEILEAREVCPTFSEWKKQWSNVLERMDALVFVRNEQRCLGHGTWTELCKARQAGKKVFMARMNKDKKLVLVPWTKLDYRIDKSSERNYARIGYENELNASR